MQTNWIRIRGQETCVGRNSVYQSRIKAEQQRRVGGRDSSEANRSHNQAGVSVLLYNILKLKQERKRTITHQQREEIPAELSTQEVGIRILLNGTQVL